MRAPDFWTRDGFLPWFLSPFAFLYDLGGKLRFSLTRQHEAGIPVICIGNLVAGGAGKTPVVLDLIHRLQSAGLEVHALTRGYGGSERGPTKVDPKRHTAAEVGDEALLIAARTETWVSADRPAGAQAARAAGAQIIVMDDGFQNPSLHKDLSLVVIDTAFGLGNARVMPAGPLREAARRGLTRADALVLLGSENAALTKALKKDCSSPTLRAGLKPQSQSSDLAGQRVLAFAGIGRPEKFYETLRNLSVEIIETRDFPDHHPYTGSEIEQIFERATALNAVAITTEKDAVRLSPEHRSKVKTLPIEVAWQNPGEVDRLFDPVIRGLSVSG